MMIVYLAALFVVGGISLALYAIKPEPKVVPIGIDPEDVAPRCEVGMSRFWNLVLKGLAAVLPIGLTLYLVVWFAVSLERALRTVILEFVPAAYYWPGMGLVAGIVVLFFIGLAVNAWVVRHLLGGALLERIPLVKSVYGALSDFAEYFFGGGTAFVRPLDLALSRLDPVAPVVKEQLVEAMVKTVKHDQQLTLGEAELLRAVCATLHCPLPPLVGEERVAGGGWRFAAGEKKEPDSGSILNQPLTASRQPLVATAPCRRACSAPAGRSRTAFRPASGSTSCRPWTGTTGTPSCTCRENRKR